MKRRDLINIFAVAPIASVVKLLDEKPELQIKKEYPALTETFTFKISGSSLVGVLNRHGKSLERFSK